MAAIIRRRQLPAARTREKLTAARTYYVRTDGSDSNDGLANSAGRAFLTIQKAITVVYGLDFGTNNVTISVQSGTYTAGATFSGRHVGSGVLSLAGSSATISVTSANAIVLVDGAVVSISGFTLQTTTAGSAIIINSASRATLGSGMTFGTCATDHIAAGDDGAITCTAAYTISGGALRHIILSKGSYTASSFTITLTGTPAFSYFIYVQIMGFANVFSVTFSGSATGTRYIVFLNSVVQTYGSGASFFPGNVAGATASGGQYA